MTPIIYLVKTSSTSSVCSLLAISILLVFFKYIVAVTLQSDPAYETLNVKDIKFYTTISLVIVSLSSTFDVNL